MQTKLRKHQAKGWSCGHGNLPGRVSVLEYHSGFQNFTQVCLTEGLLKTKSYASQLLSYNSQFQLVYFIRHNIFKALNQWKPGIKKSD